MQDYPLIHVNPVNDEYYIGDGISFERILEECQISPKELETILMLSEERLDLYISPTEKPGYFAYFAAVELFNLIECLLVYQLNTGLMELNVD